VQFGMSAEARTRSEAHTVPSSQFNHATASASSGSVASQNARRESAWSRMDAAASERGTLAVARSSESSSAEAGFLSVSARASM
jgi:hypothetical protein